MKYISITGPADNLNQVIERYISQYDIQLENTAKQLRFDEGLHPFSGVNPYVEALHKAEYFLKILPSGSKRPPFTGDEAVARVEEAYQIFEKRDITLKVLEQKRAAIQQYIERLQNFTSLDIDLQVLDEFRHIGHSFGRLPIHNFKQFEKFLYDDSEIIFVQSHSDRDYIWGVYFMPNSVRDKVNSMFSSLHFERINITSFFMDEQHSGKPSAIAAYWKEKCAGLDTEIKEMTDNTLDGIPGNNEELSAACERVRELYEAFDLRKYAAVTENGNYVFVGWMAEKDAEKLEKEVSQDEFTFFSRFGETGEHPSADRPPTRLKNPPIIRQFEFFTRMYGLPVYGEMDPTPVMAVIYTILFGLMFGDVGQGLAIALIGYYLYKKRGFDLGGIMAMAGVSGMLFGFLYGSIFGLEDILPALWRQPAEDIMGTLIFAVGVGVAIVFLSMLFNIINAVRQKNWGLLLFSPNGIAGMMFYWIILFIVLQVALYGHTISGLDIFLACFPLLFVAFREPLVKFMEGRRKVIEGGIVMFLFSTVLELIEVLLSYATNTISFIRVGAFAISHAGIMSVVLMLSQNAAGTHNPLVIILGNIVVMGIEGLLVGIQVLRLDFYEVFSRFYNGSGQLFESYRSQR